MTLCTDTMKKTLREETFAIVVTRGEGHLSSRSMLFAFSEEGKVYFLTKKTTEKIKEIMQAQEAVVHVSKHEGVTSDWFDISIRGQMHLPEVGSPAFQEGVALLAKKNSQISALMTSPHATEYRVLQLLIQAIQGWSYQQAADGLPKTFLELGDL